jgi:hypothetical protein
VFLYHPTSAVLPEVLELPPLVVHLFPSLDIRPHISFIIKQDNPLLIPPALQQLSASPSSLDGELAKQQDSVPLGKIQQVISVAEGN